MKVRQLIGFLNFVIILSLTIPFLANTAVAQPMMVTDLTLTQQNIKSWKSHIKPTEQELAWMEIDWLPDLQSGIEAARKTGKPILLWTMNGHPLGCT